MGKIIARSRLAKELAGARRKKKKIVFTNGCFDIIHAGHVRYLKKARSLGDVLVVGLNSDSSVRSIKGDKRPIVPCRERAEVLSALGCVDYVVVFNEDTPSKLIEAVRPDVLAKGADWAAKDIVGGDAVRKGGGRVARITLLKGRSTTNIIRRVLELHKGRTRQA
ncbi:MAG: D-glycero-beta-D-manno-heptose 1-phosphate adenylyltransferase [Deltaproteobacteria bacterium]|nr:D-glycero-beta-D-manno-heptose 1-phosphate adenylyltransferase [Deltaproteobacteria bacterium]MCL4873932.1 D-glycero-beta-D-manno-heptose 1-phosphate adenylyltransferase [bacterium]